LACLVDLVVSMAMRNLAIDIWRVRHGRIASLGGQLCV
jgi:hypothetical protein